MTEINDYLRLLYARVETYLSNDGTPIESSPREQMVNRVMAMPEKTKDSSVSAGCCSEEGEHKESLREDSKDGYVRVRVDGEMHEVTEDSISRIRNIILKSVVDHYRGER